MTIVERLAARAVEDQLRAEVLALKQERDTKNEALVEYLGKTLRLETELAEVRAALERQDRAVLSMNAALESARAATAAAEARVKAAAEIAQGWADCDANVVQGYGDVILEALRG